MTNRTISARIKTITLAMTGAVLLVGVMGLIATVTVAQLFGAYRLDNDRVALASSLREAILSAQQSEMEYQISPGSAAAAAVGDSLDEGARHLDAMRAALPAEENYTTTLDALEEALGDYRSAYDDLKAQTEDLSLARQTMIEAEATVTEGVSKASQTLMFDGNSRATGNLQAAVENFMQSRVAMERFVSGHMATDWKEAATRLENSRERFSNAAGAVDKPDRKAGIEAVMTSLDGYEASASQAHGAIMQMSWLSMALEEGRQHLEGNLDKIVGLVTLRQMEQARIADLTRLAAIAGLTLVGLATLAASWIFAVRVTRGIGAAVQRTVTEMRALADGDLAVEITGTEDQTELGDMGRALAVFRDNAVAARALAEETRKAEIAAREQEALDAERSREAELRHASAVEAARRDMLEVLRASVGNVVEAAAMGDFGGRITASFDAPELAALAGSINDLVAGVENGVAETARVLGRMAAGDLVARMDGKFSGIFAQLQSDMNATIDGLSDLLRDIARQCGDVGLRADTVSEQSLEITRRAEQQAASLEQTSAAMEELSVSVKSSARAASDAADFAETASGRVDAAGSVVESAIRAMADIDAASARIGDIVTVIDGIAFQTNLLALNAGVEAARAGDAGRGFAVVAQEVRALAARSGEASKDIRTLIDESSSQVKKGVDLVTETGRTLREIMDNVSRMAGIMQQLTVTAQEQATGVLEVTSAITQLDSITQQNAVFADKSSSTAHDLRDQAGTMGDLVATFRIDADEDAMAFAAE